MSQITIEREQFAKLLAITSGAYIEATENITVTKEGFEKIKDFFIKEENIEEFLKGIVEDYDNLPNESPDIGVQINIENNSGNIQM